MTKMKPTSTLGSAEEIRYAVGECWLGSILVARSARGICTVAMGSEPDDLVRRLMQRLPTARLAGEGMQDGCRSGFDADFARILAFLEAPGTYHHLRLDVGGTAFQRSVWDALVQHVPPGSTVSYRDLARAIGKPGSVRAVAGACGANALAVLIPCHRAVGHDGSLGGYAWGVERKRALLAHEAAGELRSNLQP